MQIPSPTTPEAFAILWRAAGCFGDGRTWHERLRAAWGTPERAYHTWRHLTECLTEWEEAREDFNSCCDVHAVGMALWFHVAVYDPRASDNEERSANMAAEALASGGATEAFSEMVRRLILATKTHTASARPDTVLMLDIDLSILGKDMDRYWEYEAQIREEYSWVPSMVFAEKRAGILRSFLSRDRLYSTPRFYNLYEEAARRNIAAAIERLDGMAH